MKSAPIIISALIASSLMAGAKESKELKLDQIPAKAAAAIRSVTGNAKLHLKHEKEDGVEAFFRYPLYGKGMKMPERSPV